MADEVDLTQERMEREEALRRRTPLVRHRLPRRLGARPFQTHGLDGRPAHVKYRLIARNACLTPVVLVRAALMLAGRALMMVGGVGEWLECRAARLPAWQRFEEHAHARRRTRA